MIDKQNILIVGGDSFIAKSFILFHKNDYNFSVISRTKTEFENEIVLIDFIKIPDELFKHIDIVINFAAIVHQRKNIDEDIYLKINCELAVLNAQKAKDNGVKTFIQLSTIAVYGNAEMIDCQTPENPVNHYGKSKLLADKKIISMADNFFKVIIFRAPLVYGLSDAPGNMMRLISLADKGFPLPFKNAKCKRDFINIRNFIEYIETAIKTNQTNIYLVSDDAPVSTYDLINLISKYLKKKIIQFSIPNFILSFLCKLKPELFNKLYGKLYIDLSKTKEILNYKPDHSTEQGIKEMVQWYLKFKDKK